MSPLPSNTLHADVATKTGVTGPVAANDLMGECSPDHNHSTRVQASSGSGSASRARRPKRRSEAGIGGREQIAVRDEECWGVMLRNTIIRDLDGFGMEHAGPIGRSLISKVMSVSQDNYPEMVRRAFQS